MTSKAETEEEKNNPKYIYACRCINTHYNTWRDIFIQIHIKGGGRIHNYK